MEQIRIKVETAAMEARADAAQQKIQAVRERFSKIGEIVSNSRSYWEGDAGDAHRREYQEYQEEIEEALLRFQENVTDLRKIAGIYKEAADQTAQLSYDLPSDVIL